MIQPAVNDLATLHETIKSTFGGVLRKIYGLDRYKFPGLDCFLPRVMKEVRNELSPNLATIFNTSLKNGTVLMDWKEARFTSIFKKGSAG